MGGQVAREQLGDLGGSRGAEVLQLPLQRRAVGVASGRRVTSTVSAVVGSASATGSPASTVPLGALAGLALPVGLGITGLRQADPGRRGFGLGVLLGWLLSTVVVVGVGALVAV